MAMNMRIVINYYDIQVQVLIKKVEILGSHNKKIPPLSYLRARMAWELTLHL